MTAAPLAEEFSEGPSIRGFLHQPAQRSGDGLILTHGAGSNCQSPLLAALATAFAEAGFTVLRCDLPFRQARPKGPPLGASALDREGLKRAVAALRKLVPGRIFLGGHSYGGRQASMLAAAERDLAAALLLLAYPLHPPKRPTELRTAHFPNLRTSALFVHGTRDPFGSIEELRAAVKLIPASTDLVSMEGAGHELAPGRAGEIVAAFRRFVAASATSGILPRSARE